MPNPLKYVLIFSAAFLLFIPFIGHVHLFDWDEINFAECAREMIVSKEYLRAQIDFMPFWEKPPLFIWLQVLSMKIFGIGEFAARLPNAVTGIVTLMALFFIGKKIKNEKSGTWWVLLYAASWLPNFYFKTGIIDPIFNLFIFLTFFQVYLIRSAVSKTRHIIWAGLFLGFAVLTKGPVAILVSGLSLVVYLAVNRGLNGYKIKHFLLVLLIAFTPVLAWLALAVINYGASFGSWFVSQFLIYQVRLFSTEDADHGGPFIYHFIVLLVGCFPASALLFQYFRKNDNEKSGTNQFTRWMWILFWVVLILFSIVKTKIVHYSSLCYFPLTYLAALQIIRMSENNVKISNTVKAIFLTIGSIIALLLIGLPLAGIYKNTLATYIQDPFVVANLRADVAWSWSECLWGVFYLTGIWASVMLISKNLLKGLMALCIVQIITIQATVIHFTPKIEAYSQKAAIDFYKGFDGSSVYIHALGFKSYANLFYAKKTPATDPHYQSIKIDNKTHDEQPEANEQWLLKGNTDRPTYFICKVQDSAKFAAMPQLIMLSGKNGFVFFRRR